MNLENFLEKKLKASQDSPWEPLLGSMAGALALLVLLSWVRYFWAGTLSLDQPPIRIGLEVFVRINLLLLMTWLGISFLKLVVIDLKPSDLKKLFYYSLALHFLAFLALPLTSNDIFSNLAYGTMIEKGLDVNRLGPIALNPDDPFRSLVSPHWINTPMMYGPLMGFFHRAFVWSGQIWPSLWTHKIVCLLASWGVALLVYLSCRDGKTSPGRPHPFLVTALNPVLIWEISSQSHNDGIMLIAVMGFVYLSKTKHPWGAFLSLGLSFAAKIATLPVLGLYLCHQYFVSKKRFFAMGGVLGLGGLVFLYLYAHKIDQLLVNPFSQNLDPDRILNSISFLVHVLFSPWGLSTQNLAYRVYWLLAVSFLLFLGFRMAFRARNLNQVYQDSFLYLLLLILVFVPNYQPWYVSWLIPFAPVLENRNLRYYFAIFSAVSMIQYFAMDCVVSALLNVFFLGLLWLSYNQTESLSHSLKNYVKRGSKNSGKPRLSGINP